MTTTSYTSPSRNTVVAAQVVAAFVGGFVLFLAALLVWTLGYQLAYAGRIFPGVSVAGVDVSGMSPADAAVTLNQRLAFPYNGQILLRDGERIWAASPAELGMVFDASASAQSAYRLGRTDGLFGGISAQLRARREGKSAEAVIIFDENVAYAYLQRLAAEIDQPPIEADLVIQGTEVVARPGQLGRSLNVDATLIALSLQLQTFRDGEVILMVDEIPPQLLDVSSQAEVARQILSAPLMLTLDGRTENDPGPWTVDVPTLAEMLVVQRVGSGDGSRLEVALASGKLHEMLVGIAAQVDRPAENARFVFNDETRQLDVLQSSVIGRVVDLDASKEVINQGLLSGAHEIAVQVVSDAPEVLETMTAADFGITELISAQTSYFYGSSAERIQNIQTAAAAFHGVMIAPGETFAMGNVLGDISLDNGYAEALIIYGGRTIKGVGGGVCQVSTTLFRTVFFAGFPVAERNSHAYRVYYYEQSAGGGRNTSLVGLDATVYFPLVDFKFTNDTPYWLLMETYMDVAGRSLTWKFYSTSDGRTVDWQTTGTQNVVPAPPPLTTET
ncbi:MAG: VanW family protein, partial [Anaerolineales bacterium]|nr:VanW family protein [Anaerolineales bacterium]